MKKHGDHYCIITMYLVYLLWYQVFVFQILFCYGWLYKRYRKTVFVPSNYYYLFSTPLLFTWQFIIVPFQRYAPPGQPALAGRIIDVLRADGLKAEGDSDRGFDHGVFIPLKLMYPEADIPVVQVGRAPGTSGACRSIRIRPCMNLNLPCQVPGYTHHTEGISAEQYDYICPFMLCRSIYSCTLAHRDIDMYGVFIYVCIYIICIYIHIYVQVYRTRLEFFFARHLSYYTRIYTYVIFSSCVFSCPISMWNVTVYMEPHCFLHFGVSVF